MKNKTNDYILSEREEAFITYMKNNHLGKENAVIGKELKKRWGDYRKMRIMIHDLRVNGFPICSGNEGYWYAASSQEINDSIRYYDSYIEDLMQISSGLKNSLHTFA